MKRSRGVDKKESAAARTLTLPGCGSVAAYIRVSSASQDHASQRHAIELAARARGEAIDRWFADTTTGAVMERPQLARLWRALETREVSRVWVWRLDRLSRAGALPTLEAVQRVRAAGATLASVADPFTLEGPAAEVILVLVAWCNEQERLKIRENQAAARARLEEQGRNWGRPRLPAHKRDAAALLASQGKSIREIARELQISKTKVGEIVRAQKRGF